jgi:hypothetical protein
MVSYPGSYVDRTNERAWCPGNAYRTKEEVYMAEDKHFFGRFNDAPGKYIEWTACGISYVDNVPLTNFKPAVTCQACRESDFFKDQRGFRPPPGYKIFTDDRPNPPASAYN